VRINGRIKGGGLLGFALKAGLAALSLFSAAPCFAGSFDRSGVGTTAAQFLKLSATARGSALAECMTVLADDASALYWNPAALIEIQKRSVVFTHAAYIADTYYDYAAYGQKFGDMGAFGASIQYMNHGNLTGTNASGIETGSFTPYDLAVSMGFSSYISGFNKYPEERFVLGVSAKVISSKIVNQDSTITMDAGILTPWLMNNRFRMGLTAQNIMGGLRFGNETSKMPFLGKLGGRVRLLSMWDLLFDVAAPVDNYPYASAATEIRVNVLENLRVDLRAGATTRAASDLDGLRNVSFGLGFAGSTLGLDYAFNPFGDLGNAHRVTLKVSF
jgi:hypothetical protein